MSPICWGVDLVRMLEQSGTGEAKLAIARKAIADRWHHDQQHATAEEIYVALEGAGVGELTLTKARSLIDNGTAFVATRPKMNIEDMLPPPPPSPGETQFGTAPTGDNSQFGSPKTSTDGITGTPGDASPGAGTPGAGMPLDSKSKSVRKS